jgi:copper transport protein
LLQKEEDSKMSYIRQVSKIGGMLLFLALLGVLLAACSGGGNAQTQTTGTLSAFHTMLRTSDGMFLIQFNVTPDRSGSNTFTVNVDDVSTGKPASNLYIQLSTTMLDMDMGTDQVDLQPNGRGQYKAAGELSMSGHWEIRILLHTPDATLHQAQVQLSTQV